MSESKSTPPVPSRFARLARRALPWLVAVTVLVGGVFVYLRWSQSHAAPAVEYKTAPADKRKIVGKVTASGTLQALVTVQVGTQVSGRIQKLFVDFNSPVKKGDAIAKIDPQMFAASVAQAHASYDAAKASVEQANAKQADAQLTADRTHALAAQSLASAIDVQAADTAVTVAKANVDAAKASLEQAKAQLDLAQVNLSYTDIVSPIDGVVISRNVDVGQTVAASLQAPVLFTIAEDLKKMQVNTNIAEGDVGRLQPGMPTSFTVDAFPGQRFKGKVSQIRNAAQTVQNVVTYDAVIDVENDDLKLRPGMTANVTINYETRDDALALPNAALRFRPPPGMVAGASGGASASGSGSADGGGGRRGPRDDGDSRTVWVMRAGVAAPVTVKIGLSDGTVTEITGGDLAAGDLVVTDATVNGAAATTAAAAGGTRRLF